MRGFFFLEKIPGSIQNHEYLSYSTWRTVADHGGKHTQVAVSSQLRSGPEWDKRCLRRISLDSGAVVTFPSTSRELFLPCLSI